MDTSYARLPHPEYLDDGLEPIRLSFDDGIIRFAQAACPVLGFGEFPTKEILSGLQLSE